MASGGIGSTPHLCGELFTRMTGIEMVHVPYRGGVLAMTDLISGQVQVIFNPLPAAIEQIKAGRLWALGVTTTSRAEALPDVPTIGEFVSGYEASTWNGLAVPRNTPAEIVNTLNAEINRSFTDFKITTRFADLGGAPLPGSPGDMGKLMLEETEKWGKVIRAANIKPE